MELLEERGNASTVFLAKALGLSESSVRRDINRMASLPQYPDVRRVHGGVLLDRDAAGLEYMFELKLELNRGLKQRVAAEAARLIEDGDSIVIDSGTTCLYLARRLADRKGLRIVTTDLKVAEELGKHGGIESNIIGGLIRPGYYTVGGIVALENLERFSAEKVFLSVDAIDLEHGITNASEFEVGIKQRLLRMARQVHVICDRTKVGTHTLYRVADITEARTIVTNRDLDERLAARLRAAGVVLALA